MTVWNIAPHLHGWKRCVWQVPFERYGTVEMVTREFHEAYVAELFERIKQLSEKKT